MRAASSRNLLREARGALWTLLDAEGEVEFSSRVVSQVRGALAEERASSIPIRLSRIAHRFSIAERPVWCEPHEHAGIDYDPGRACFVIQMPRVEHAEWRDGSVGGVGMTVLSGERFAFAHEFAHRFFFIERGGVWGRAVRFVLEALDGSARASAFRHLHALEERVCNRLASQFLVPTDVFTHPGVLPEVSGVVEHEAVPLHRYIIGLARRCEVSPEAIIVAMGRGDVLAHMPHHSDVLVLLIRESAGPRSLLGSSRRLRVAVALTPDTYATEKLRPLYAGMPLDVLGDEVVSFSRDQLDGAVGRGLVIHTCSIRALSVAGIEARRERSLRFGASWFAWETPHGGRELLVWGRVEGA